MKKDFPIYALLFAIYPILLAWSINVSLVSTAHTFRSFFLVLLVTLLLITFLKLITRDWLRAGLITTLFVFSLLYYGYLIQIIERWWSGNAFDLHRYAVSIIMALLVFGSWAIWRLLKPDAVRTIHNALTAVVIVLLLVPTFQIVSYLLVNTSLKSAPNIQVTAQPIDDQTVNDIYYIILDEYTRDDVLIELFDYDNTPFLNNLRDKGFIIPSNSPSNYSSTTPSIASSLNMDYIQNLTESVDQLDQNKIKSLVHNSRIREIMQQEGYQFINFDSGYEATRMRDADIYLSHDSKTINQFELILMQNSLPGMIFLANLNFEAHRQRILYTFDQLAQVPQIPGKKFVFAHIISPHPPFVFDAQGNKISATQHYSFGVTANAGISQENYIEGYRGQVEYINSLIEDTVTEILENSESPPIIIIQGDHGTRTYTDWDSIENSCLKERMSIFNAYYFPDEVEELYDTISPVNTFRIMLNNYFDADLDLLPDKSYFSREYQANDFVDITNDIEPYCFVDSENNK